MAWKLITTAFLLSTITAVYVHAANTQALRPPKGARVALVVFEDLQCPDCARANPLLEEAARTYKIPLVRHDFPLPMHNWSYRAAILARYFDTKSEKLGDEYRDAVFQHQLEITPETLQAFTEKWAAEHKTTVPFVVDPNGSLERKVKTDYALGQSVGIQHTPTIYVVSNSTTGTPFVEVVDRSQLFRMIEDMLEQTKASQPVKTASRRK
jgi:protein-disulfide isomerase